MFSTIQSAAGLTFILLFLVDFLDLTDLLILALKEINF